LGYLPENNPLYDLFTPIEYVSYIASMKSQKDRHSIDQIVNLCGLTNVAQDKIDTLSRGYKQRVGIAAALVGNPSVLILDEPTTGLDPNQREEIKKLIKRLKITTLFSSHILSEVKDICQEVIIINQGVIVADGRLSDLMRKGGSALRASLKITKNQKSAISMIRKELLKLKVKLPRAYARVIFSARFVGSGISPKRKNLRIHTRSYDRGFLRRRTKAPLFSTSGSIVKIKFSGVKDSGAIKDALWKLCQKNNLPLEELKETGDSLEDVFHKLTK